MSPAAAPWTVLIPGAEGEIVAAVQQALIAADVEVAGGADGVYGNDTMAAVAEYQRSTDALLVTGAVDMPTARALGVYTDSTDDTPATSAPATTVPRSLQSATVGDVGEPAGLLDAGHACTPIAKHSPIIGWVAHERPEVSLPCAP